MICLQDRKEESDAGCNKGEFSSYLSCPSENVGQKPQEKDELANLGVEKIPPAGWEG